MALAISEDELISTDVHEMRTTLRDLERCARAVRRELRELEAGSSQRELAERLRRHIVELLERSPNSVFSPQDVVRELGLLGDASAVMRRLAADGEIAHLRHGAYQAVREGGESV